MTGPDGIRAVSESVLESPILPLLRELHARFFDEHDGAVASYIPELSRVDPDQFGIALVTADGHLYEIGETRASFTIQSISKPLVYGLVLQDHGRDAVLRRIGVEPSGEAFNEIRFDDHHNRPFNAMVNTGAIAATSLVRGATPEERLARMLDLFRALSGQAVTIDESVYLSEKETGNRNRAIGYLELNNGMIEGDVDAHLDLYFRQCAIQTSAASLAFTAATLANGGVHPLTGERALPAEHVRDVLSVMTSCGMYDFAGEWQLRIGLPAKSGVGGGIMAVLPGQLGIGIFSPRLDAHGSSHRGIRVCEALSDRLQLHLLDYRGRARSAIRRSYRASDVRSKRRRSTAARQLLDRHGGDIAVVELHGNLFFGNTEQALRSVLDMGDVRYLVLAMGHVTSIDAVAAGLLRELIERLTAAGCSVRLAAVAAALHDILAIDAARHGHDVNSAIEHCEDALLRTVSEEDSFAAAAIPLDDFSIVAEMTPAELAILRGHLSENVHADGETIITEGSDADSLYFLVAGTVDVCVAHIDGGGTTRLATIDAGNIFGELAVLGDPPRTADVTAATDVTLLELHTADFAALSRDHPATAAKLVIGVARSLAARLHRANTVIQALEG